MRFYKRAYLKEFRTYDDKYSLFAGTTSQSARILAQTIPKLMLNNFSALFIQ